MFISRDPAGFVDGPNVYAYVKQNPWTAFDPDGLETKKQLNQQITIIYAKYAQTGGDYFRYKRQITVLKNRIKRIDDVIKWHNDALAEARTIDPVATAHMAAADAETIDDQSEDFKTWGGSYDSYHLLGKVLNAGLFIIGARTGGAKPTPRSTTLLPQTEQQAAAEAAALGYNANKLHHIFGKADHVIEPLVKQFGSEGAAMVAIHKAAQSLASSPSALSKGAWIDVGGNQVWVKGALVNGEVRVGTASMNTTK